jgi:hypothetical protein
VTLTGEDLVEVRPLAAAHLNPLVAGGAIVHIPGRGRGESEARKEQDRGRWLA